MAQLFIILFTTYIAQYPILPFHNLLIPGLYVAYSKNDNVLLSDHYCHARRRVINLGVQQELGIDSRSCRRNSGSPRAFLKVPAAALMKPVQQTVQQMDENKKGLT